MASTIILRNMGGVDDKKVALSNSTMRRLLSIGTSWSKLRIALRYGIVDSGASVTSTPRFVIGLCSGTDNPHNNGTAATTHFVGARTTTATWSRSPGPPISYSVSTWRPYTRVGTTDTDSTGHFSSAGATGKIATEYRLALMLDIAKGSPNFTFSFFGPSNIFVPDLSYEDFLVLAELPTPSRTYYTFTSGVTHAVDEANGALNAVNISWDRTTPKIEISDVVIVRFA